MEPSLRSVKKRREGRKAGRYSSLAAPSRVAQGRRSPALGSWLQARDSCTISYPGQPILGTFEMPRPNLYNYSFDLPVDSGIVLNA
jgi:hypothetical protein